MDHRRWIVHMRRIAQMRRLRNEAPGAVLRTASLERPPAVGSFDRASGGAEDEQVKIQFGRP
jgi:hypothetical protein